MQPSRPRVLIADDDSAIRDLVRSILTTADYDVETAASGARAMAMISPGRFSGLILDLTMPEMDGFGVLESLKRSTRPPPVLVMSARHSPEDVKRAIALGAKDYLAKPFTNGQLVARMARLIRHGQLSAKRLPPATTIAPLETRVLGPASRGGLMLD